MSEPRFVKLYGGEHEERICIVERGAYLEMSVERQRGGAWCSMGQINVPSQGASTIGDVAAALVIVWEDRRRAEMAEREAKAKL